MTQRLTGYVHLFHNGELVTLAPGDILPEWADNIVTNPDVIEDADVESTVDDTGNHPDEDTRTLKELRAAAKTLGLSGGGSKAEIAARIAAAEEPVESDARAALEAKATEAGISFTSETTDVELELLTQIKE